MAANPIRVLIADDHPVVRIGLRNMLLSDPVIEVVGEARDGVEARTAGSSVLHSQSAYPSRAASGDGAL